MSSFSFLCVLLLAYVASSSSAVTDRSDDGLVELNDDRVETWTPYDKLKRARNPYSWMLTEQGKRARNPYSWMFQQKEKRAVRFADDIYRQPRNPYSWMYTMFEKRARNPYSWMNTDA